MLDINQPSFDGKLYGQGSQVYDSLFFDTGALGTFTEILDFPVESSNSSGYDQVIDHVTLTIHGTVGSVPPPVPEPSTMTILASGLGTLFFIVRRRRRTG
jgi:hypothetical protein